MFGSKPMSSLFFELDESLEVDLKPFRILLLTPYQTRVVYMGYFSGLIYLSIYIDSPNLFVWFQFETNWLIYYIWRVNI